MNAGQAIGAVLLFSALIAHRDLIYFLQSKAPEEKVNSMGVWFFGLYFTGAIVFVVSSLF